MEPKTYRLMRNIEDSHWWFVARREIINAVLDRLELPQNSNILEVGCGTGGNIALLNQYGTVTCMERNNEAAKMARERGIADVLFGELPDGIPEFQEKFDLVTLFDVIEHVKEDSASLQNLSNLLKPRGRIFLTVPAFNFLWSIHDDENHHQRRYRRQDLRELVTKNGLTLDYMSYFNFWLFLPVAAVRVLRKIIPYKEAWSDLRQPNDWVNRILQSIFSSERHFIGRSALPFGISLMAVISVPDREDSS